MAMSNDLSQGMSIGTTLGLLGSLNRSIVSEYGDTTAGTHSLSEFYAGGNNVPAGTSGAYGAIPSSGTIAMSKFFNSTKVTNIHSSAFTNGALISQYFQKSGFFTGSQGGSMVTTAISGTFQGSTNVVVRAVNNQQTTPGMSLELTVSSGTKTFTDTGFTSISFYLNQSNDSGSADLTLLRSNKTSFGSSNSIATWTWSGSYAISSFFGSSPGNTHFFVME